MSEAVAPELLQEADAEDEAFTLELPPEVDTAAEEGVVSTEHPPEADIEDEAIALELPPEANTAAVE